MVDHYGSGIRPRYLVNPPGVDRTIPHEPAGPEMRLLVMGRLVPDKGIGNALSALGSLRGFPWSLDIVGDGPCRSALEQQMHELGLGARVRFHGIQPNPAKYYSRADLLLFPSRSESFGLVVVEAMAHGVPTLAFRPDGKEYRTVTDEIVSPGRTGLLARGMDNFRHSLSEFCDNRGCWHL